MAIINTNGSFGSSDTVTSTNLNAVADGATFNDPVDETTLQLHTDGKLRIKAGGVDTNQIADSAVTKAKIEDVADMKVLGNTSGAAAAPQEVEVIDATSGIASNDNDTSIPTSAAVKSYVDSSHPIAIIESDSLGARNGSTYYFNNLSETIDVANIVSESSGEITFSSTGTYLIDISGSFIDSDTNTNDVYNLVLTSGTGSTDSLLNQAVRYDSNAYRPISIKYVRTVTNTVADKLAIYASPVSAASNAHWQASDVVITITKLT